MLLISEIVKATNGKLVSKGLVLNVDAVSTDSRNVLPGELFFAIVGEKFDAHNFLNEVVKKGITAVVVSKPVSLPAQVAVIKVKDTTEALGDLARYYRNKFDIPVIAITGSAGKTTTKDMIASVLSERYQVLKSVKSFNNKYGVPLTILKLRKEHMVLILELGTNHRGEIAALAKIAQPTMCVFTTIGESHLEGLGSTLGVFKEKSQMVRHMKRDGIVVYNSDNKYLRAFSSDKYRFPKFSYSVEQESDFKAEDIKQDARKISFKVKNQDFILSSPVSHNTHNALAALVCGKLLGLSYNEIKSGLKKFKNPDGRQNICAIKKRVLIDDTYNANPVSYRSAIDTLNKWSGNVTKILVCGDMLELGEEKIEQHKSLGRVVADTNIDVVVTLGTNAAYIGQEVKKFSDKKVYICKTIKQVESRLKTVCRNTSSVILVKGSRGMKMERAVEFLKQYFKKL
ncbi:MAG: UDP-N-acetylmuramoyl-tripeptide--D-alanyl-D-alanine ligase [Candidatus Omnitrophica bacterium]|nr:UDP-N-acetylmuramoyl-tripeptide--D-alanyl-D-alanine ligase [Candidatus Omnitrophota bacterium]